MKASATSLWPGFASAKNFLFDYVPINMTLPELCNLIGAHPTDCMNKAKYGRVARPLFDFSESGLGTRLGDHISDVTLEK